MITGTSQDDPGKKPRRIDTDPLPRMKIKKRVIVCCDGTWQDGVDMTNRCKYTNILRLARSISHEDARFNPPIPQIVFYQSGIGSGGNIYSEYIDGTTGASLGGKVHEAYAFIAHNYQPGDEIFLFGFSRGAYTARMVAMFIGEIGVLNRTDMDHFGDIFMWYHKRGDAKNQGEIDFFNQKLALWTDHNAPGKKMVDCESFSIKIVGVFETVGSLGLPEELTFRSPGLRTIFGFPDKLLGEHIERAYHALAINEMRKDFDCAKFEQTEGGRRKKQILKQCWFTGSHSDIGGGWEYHDLSDLTLTWMAANIGDALSLDLTYLASLPEPVAPWGAQTFNDPMTGIFCMAKTIQRQLPTSTDNVTHETIHPSVLEQLESVHIPAALKDIKDHPELICSLMPLEDEMKKNWPFDPLANQAKMYATKNNQQSRNIFGFTRELSDDVLRTATTETTTEQDSSMGAALHRELHGQT